MKATALLAAQRISSAVLFSFIALGCGSNSEVTRETRPDGVLAELDILPTPQGGVALYTPVIELQSGADVTHCTFTDFIAEEDLFIRTTRGAQSHFGHHAIMFHTTEIRPPGTVLCGGSDMETFRQLMGGSGGEGQANYEPPDRVGVTVRRGSQLVIQTHWINASADLAEVQAMMVTVPGLAGPDRIDTGTVTLVDLSFDVPAQGRATSSVSCTFVKEHRLFMAIGHEHEWGSHVRANLTRAGGLQESLFDRPFEPHHVFDPPVNTYDIDNPLVLSPGDKIDFECQWENTTSEALGFPREMCVFFGYSMETGDERCINGAWLGAGSPDGGATIPGPPCVADGAAGNELGVGKNCTKGGGQCAANGGASICILDHTTGEFGNFCTKLCGEDADCGTGATCQGSSPGSPKACIPACISADAGAP